MKLGILAGGVCRICGSDTMGSDIGCGCRGMYERAKFICLRLHDKDSLEYNYGIKMRHIMNMFVGYYDESFKKHDGKIEKMFKTDFNRSFYPSVYAQYKEKGYVSKKQLDIVSSKLQFGCQDDITDTKDIQNEKDAYMNNFTMANDNEIVEIARNLWKQKKEDK